MVTLATLCEGSCLWIYVLSGSKSPIILIDECLTKMSDDSLKMQKSLLLSGVTTQMFKEMSRRRQPESSFNDWVTGFEEHRDDQSSLIRNSSAFISQGLQDFVMSQRRFITAPVCRPRPGALCCRWSCCPLRRSCASPPPRSGHRAPSSCCLPEHKEKWERDERWLFFTQPGFERETGQGCRGVPPPKKTPSTNKRLTDAWAT